MKTFSKFLHEAYFSEAQVTQSGEPSTGQAQVTYGRTAPGGRFRSPKEQEAYEITSRREAEKELRRLRRGPTGAAVRRDLQFKSPSSSSEITATPTPAAPASVPAANVPPPPGASRTTPAAPASAPAASQRTPGWMARNRPISRSLSSIGVVNTALDVSRGDYGSAAQNAYITAMGSQRANQFATRLGQRGVQSAATRLGMKGAGQIAARFVPGLQTAYGIYRGTSALNRGDYLGAALGYGSALPVVGGAVALADIARDVVSPYDENKARADASRSSRQVAAKSGQYGARYGSAVTGGGGNTFVSRNAKGNAFISTGGGRNRVTTQLAKTQLVRDPKTGKQVVGDLAFRGGKATYLARPSIASRDTNLWSRFSRWSGIGGQRQADAAAAKKEYRTALANTQRYQKAIKGKK